MTQFYMFWIQKMHRRLWNSVICGDVEKQAKVVLAMLENAANDYDTFIDDGAPTKLLPYGRTNSIRQIAGREGTISVGSMQKPDKIRVEDISMAHLTEVGLWKETPGKTHGFGRPSGFIAPVWLDNKHLKKQVLEQFNFYEDMFYIYRKVGNRVKQAFSQILTFSIIPQPLLGAMQIFSRLALLLYRGTPRLVIHAGDMKAMGEENLLSLVKFASAKREKIMYKDL